MTRRSRSRSRTRSRSRSRTRSRTRRVSNRRRNGSGARRTKRSRSTSAGRRTRRNNSMSRYKRGGGPYGTSASLDYGNPGNYGDYGNYGPSTSNPYVGGGPGSNPAPAASEASVAKLSQNISSVIADLRAKLRRNMTNTQHTGGSPSPTPVHYGGFHRSSFLNKLRKRN